MLKRFSFGIEPGEQAWRTGISPIRAVRCEPVEDEANGCPFIIEWFDDEDALADLAEWDTDGDIPRNVVIAREIVQRGADWLDRRWTQAGRKWKHVALARRARHLDFAEFSQRWKAKAGFASTRSGSAPSPIPEAARGLAYAQNHPVPRASGDWLFDAITEVWFNDAASMQQRVDWFRENLAQDDLFAETCLFAVTEDVLIS